MMYSEFINISEYGENYITFTEYHDYVEPIYMECDLSKQDFIGLLKNTIHQFVEPIVERAINNLPLPDKLVLAFSDEEPVEFVDRIARIDFEARKVVYQYLKLMLTI